MAKGSRFRKLEPLTTSVGRWPATLYRGRRNIATAGAAGLALALGFHVVLGHNGLIAYRQKMQSTDALITQMQSLQRENDLLKGHVDRLQSDPDAIEHQAREELHYTRPGEVIYTLPSTLRGARIEPLPAQHR